MKPVRVLLVDDHAIVRAGIRVLLEREAWLQVCGEAGDGAQSLELLARLQPDVLLLDISLPDISGLKVLQEARRRYPRLPVVMLTMHSEGPWHEEALRAGAHGFVVKGSSPNLLLTAIRQAVPEHVLPETPLSARETEVLRLIAEGLTSREIAERLQISKHTVERHRTNIASKLNLSKRGHLMRSALRHFGKS